MDYLDTSFLIGAITREARTSKILEWLEENASQQLLISDWTMTEVSSALSVKIRTEQLTAEQRARSMAAFDRLRTQSLTVLPVRREDFARAAAFAERHELNVRFGDALHLAVAASAGAEMMTSDARMAAAAPALGVPAKLIA